MEIRDKWFIENGFFRKTIDRSNRTSEELYIPTKKWVAFMNWFWDRNKIYPWWCNNSERIIVKEYKKDLPNNHFLVTPDMLIKNYNQWIKSDGKKWIKKQS